MTTHFNAVYIAGANSCAQCKPTIICIIGILCATHTQKHTQTSARPSIHQQPSTNLHLHGTCTYALSIIAMRRGAPPTSFVWINNYRAWDSITCVVCGNAECDAPVECVCVGLCSKHFRVPRVGGQVYEKTNTQIVLSDALWI